MKLWSSFDPDYIEGKFNEYLESLQPIRMWQEPIQDYPEIYGVVTKVSTNEFSITVDEQYRKHFNKLSLQKALLFHSALDDMHFKKDLFSFDTSSISFSKPNEVRFRDNRVTQRYYYKYQDFKSITYTIGEFGEKESDILTDISNSGVSFVIPTTKRDKIEIGDTLCITALTDQELPEGLQATVKYIVPYQISRESTSNLIQVGLNFKNDLESISYASVGTFIKRKQQKVKGLDTTGFNGLNPNEFERKIGAIKAKNAQLAANIRERVEDLDRLRYLTTEMKRNFLLDINHDLLAAALRLSSKELIFDLLSDVTDSMREEFLEKLDVAKPASAVNKAQDEICRIIHNKEKTGELILDPRSYIKYV